MNGSVDDEEEQKKNIALFSGANKATIEARVADIQQSQDALAKARVATTYADTRMKKFLGEVLGIPHEYIVLGSWACPESPTKMCFYDQRDGSCHDYCLICGEPDERK